MTRIPPSQRRAIEERARERCEYCQSSMNVTGQEHTVDHVIPSSRGGTDEFDNLCLCCFECNTYKQARVEAPDPLTGSIVPLFNPRAERWTEHFRWSASGTRIIGRTAVGRATIRALNLNRVRLVRSRKVWVCHGLHPPGRSVS
jgi:hypothetical protein